MKTLLPQWKKGLVMSVVLILGPAVIVPETLRLWQLGWTFFGVFLLLSSQPNVQYAKLGHAQSSGRDRKSLVAIIIAGYISVLVPVVLFFVRAYAKTFPSSSWVILAVATFGLSGMFFRMYAIQVLGKFFTAAVVIQDDHQLCERGPYRWLRHPSYTGNLLFMCSIPIVLGSPYYSIWVFVLWMVVYGLRTRAEESALKEKFGQLYVDYQHRTSAMIPWVF